MHYGTNSHVYFLQISNLEKLKESAFYLRRVLECVFARDLSFKGGVSSSKGIPVPKTRFPSAFETMTRLLPL